MFENIFKKTPPASEPVLDAAPETDDGAAWERRLHSAFGNDAELLALAINVSSIDHRLASVSALTSEEGLKAAEREFRKRARRAHTLAKQRFQALVKLRETRASAAELILAASALVEAVVIPANRLAELIEAWERLPQSLIEIEDKSRFAILQERLAELIRARGERKRCELRWSAAATQALAELKLTCSGLTAVDLDFRGLGSRIAVASDNVKVTLAAMPATTSSSITENSALASLAAAIESALQDAGLILARLAILGELHECPTQHQAVSSEVEPFPVPEAVTASAIQHWQMLPPISDQLVASALNTRFDELILLQDIACKKLQKKASLSASKERNAARQENIQTLMSVADATEAALAAGHFAEAGKRLGMLQTAAGRGGGSVELQARIGALQSEFARLKGWQRWGGGRVREDLVHEAEALAASTVVPEGSSPVKLPITQIERHIEQLHARWKELDRLGGATSQPLWQRFDSALKLAYLPVAAHLTQLRSARQKNLAARNDLLTTLDDLHIVDDSQSAPDWKVISQALIHFQKQWRKLGPIEHAVPRKSQPALLDRMKASIARLENPLKEMHASAQAEREQLVFRANALRQDVQSRNPQSRDMMATLRELQSLWQRHAKCHPLPRKTENLLWAEFKTATDAVMNQREAAFRLRDAEFEANLAMREALIAQLEDIPEDASPADTRRVLASVAAEWHKAGEVPRNQAAKLESRYRAAREQAHEQLAAGALRFWQFTCDTLLAKLTLCEALESSSPSADIEARWNIQPSLPTCWEHVLQARYKAGCENAQSESRGGDKPDSHNLTNSGEHLDQLLLQLEASLEIPSPATFQLARQKLKLLAMKDAMEGRKSVTPDWPDIEAMTAAAIGCTPRNRDQRSRLQSIIAALRNSSSGILRSHPLPASPGN